MTVCTEKGGAGSWWARQKGRCGSWHKGADGWKGGRPGVRPRLGQPESPKTTSASFPSTSEVPNDTILERL